MKKITILLLLIYFNGSHSIVTAKLNKENNVIEFCDSSEAMNQKTKLECENCCRVFTPLAPYNNITCVVTAPKQVCVGLPFVIDFAINVRATTYVGFWADLMPVHDDMIAQGLKLVGYKLPTVGVFEEYTESVANKGGTGRWRFDLGIPVGTHHMSFTYIAQKPGLKSFTTLLATNPPSYINVLEINAVDELPFVQNDFVKMYNDQPTIISVLDNDYGHTPLIVKAVSKPAHGSAVINTDNTVTYAAFENYEGMDRFVYTVEDMAGNKAKAFVDVEVCKRPIIFIEN